MPELLAGLGRWEQSLPKDPQQRPFAKLKRQPDGRFSDDDLVKIITEGIEDTSGEFSLGVLGWPTLNQAAATWLFVRR